MHAFNKAIYVTAACIHITQAVKWPHVLKAAQISKKMSQLNRYVAAGALCITALVAGIIVDAELLQQQVNALRSEVVTLQVTVSALKGQLTTAK